MPTFSVTAHDATTDGFLNRFVVAPTAGNAIIIFRKDVERLRKTKLSQIRTVRLSVKEEQDLILDRLYNFFPEIYLRHWMPGIKSIVLIRKAKKEMGKDWIQVWSKIS